MNDERTHEYTQGLHGWITHTELSSDDPVACALRTVGADRLTDRRRRAAQPQPRGPLEVVAKCPNCGDSPRADQIYVDCRG